MRQLEVLKVNDTCLTSHMRLALRYDMQPQVAPWLMRQSLVCMHAKPHVHMH